MIAYIFTNSYYNKVTLPATISGVYSLFNNTDKFLINIEEEGNAWVIRENSNVELSENNTKLNKLILENYKIYCIKEKSSNIIFNLVITPRYDQEIQIMETTKPQIIVGTTNEADIHYTDPNIPPLTLKIYKVNTFWSIETDNNEVYVNGTQCNRYNLLHGDYIFYYGLRLIIINNRIICNNPNKKITINKSKFTEFHKSTEENTIEFLDEIDDDYSLYKQEDYFFKSPRFISLIEEETIKVDEPPAAPEENDTPIILTIGPQLTLLATSSLTLVNYLTMFLDGTTTFSRFLFSAGTICITIVGALLWPSLTRKFNKKRIEKLNAVRKEKYSQYIDKKIAELQAVKQKQKQVLIDNSIPLNEIKMIIDNKDRKLWEKNIEHEDFLNIRLGIGHMPTKIKINIPEEKFSLTDTDSLQEAHLKLMDQSNYIEDVPMSISLVEHNVTAVLENGGYGKYFIDGLFLRLFGQHAYTELKIVVFTTEKNQKKWDYLKIIPHNWNNNKTMRYFADTPESVSKIAGELEKIFDIRSNKKNQDIGNEPENEDQPYKNDKPYFLIFTDDVEALRNINFIKKILKSKLNYGFSLLMINDRLTTLPSETKTFLHISSTTSGLITNELTTSNQKEFQADFPENIDIYNCAQKIANIPILVEKEKYELPSSLTFLEMYNVGKVEHLNCLDRWKNNNPVNNISVPIGIDQNGEIFKMDIHEKVHGPHGLVAGTTGSGKSEWIVTYILSLAVNFSPEEIQFVLIDYKGGGLAMSFENAELGIKLPHIAGIITNLDKSAINRSIESIESELKRRQTIFNETREKLKEGSMNIYKYQELYRKKLVTEPMSHLLIISDEFAELKQQQPEFMEQLISTSRIGRSLGVHLILATQKPSGVVNDQIWSNSKFKVCLKVQNQGDSNEILKKPDAAFLKTAGAFYLSVGNDDYYNLGQSAWAGAKYFPSDAVIKKIDQSVELIDALGQTITTYSEEKNTKTLVSKGEELINIVSYIDQVSKKQNNILKDLWLPNVADISYITVLNKKYNHTPVPYVFNIPIGEYDEPRRQEQGLLTLDISKGNIAIIGQTGSGKQSLISTIIYSAMIEHVPQSLNIYILDFGSETLKKFAKYPHVGEVIYQDELDKSLGILDIILEELENRKELFENYNGSFEYYNQNSPQKVPLINLIIHGFDIFSELMPKIVDYISNMLRDCPKYGITLILTSSAHNGIKSRQMQYINNKIILQLNDDSLYRNITNCRRGLIPSKIFGRGIIRIGEDENSFVEFQTANIAPPKDEYQFIKNYGDQLTEYYKYKAKELTKIPDDVSNKDLEKYISDLTKVPIGFDFYQKQITMYDFIKNKINMIITKNISENINSIAAIINLLSKIQNTKIRVVDLTGKYNKQNIDIKIFKDNYDTVFAALESDILNRTEIEPIGINIIIGAGSLKTQTSAAGYSIIANMFENIDNSKNIITILVDDYENIRKLKIEPWFNKINCNDGLWIGSGISNQNILNVNELSMDDKKINFENIGYAINNSDYTLIKTVIDSEE